MKIVSIKQIIINEIIPLQEMIIIQGWVKTRRDSKLGFSFLNINDGSCLQNLQVIAYNTLKNYKTDVLSLNSGCSVKVIGKLIISKGVKQKYELIAEEILVYGGVEDNNSYPITSKYHSIEFLRSVAHLKIRTDLFGTISRLRSKLAFFFHDFLFKNGFLWVPTPIITTSNTEGGGELFKITTLDFCNLPLNNNCLIDFEKDFFGKQCFLTVSGQLNAESYACGLSKVYTFGPVFRAERSTTIKHLSEFWMLEPELAFYTLEDLILFIKQMLRHVLNKLLNDCDSDLNFLQNRLNIDILGRVESLIVSERFKEINYNEAIKILLKNNNKFLSPVFWGMDLNNEHEKYLTETFYRGNPVIITNFPKKIKPFYMRLNEDEKTVAAIDLLVPKLGEILGGSQREERLEYLELNMKYKKINEESYSWYKDLRKYGTIPHAGFGLGFERLLCYITGIDNVKDIVPFPRSYKNASF